MQSCHDLWKAAKAATDAMIQTVYPLIRVELDNPNHGTQYTLTIDSSGDVLAHRRSTGPPFVMKKDGKEYYGLFQNYYSLHGDELACSHDDKFKIQILYPSLLRQAPKWPRELCISSPTMAKTA
jgi:hypothetical protein